MQCDYVIIKYDVLVFLRSIIVFDSIRCHNICAVFGVKVIHRFIFAGLTVQRIRLIDHLPYLVWLDAGLCKLALNLISC